jgi:hypothetical protein
VARLPDRDPADVGLVDLDPQLEVRGVGEDHARWSAAWS